MNTFISRHIGASHGEQRVMLSYTGADSIDQLIDETIPAHIRLERDIALDPPLSEHEYLRKIKDIARKNNPLRTLIGMGCYGTATPAVIMRNIFENPAWYTSYTPYQAEISQGRLEALLNFQTMVSSLTGLEVSNCSLLCEATAAAEAVHTMYDLRPAAAVKAGKNVLFVDNDIFPQTLAVIRTRCEAQGIEVQTGSIASYAIDERCFGAVAQYPSASGGVRSYAKVAAALHERGALFTAICDILALAMLQEPAAFGADIAVGSAQRFGVPMGFGGPYPAYMACKKEYVRSMAGRIIGVSVDRLGRRAFRMALQTREQHIKRERAGSNICTAQALMAVMAGMYAAYHGMAGVRAIAERVHGCAAAFAQTLWENGLTLASDCFFDTLEVRGIDAADIRQKAEKAGFNFYYPAPDAARISFDELSTPDEAARAAAVFCPDVSKKTRTGTPKAAALPLRKTAALYQPVFNRFPSETAMMRYIKELERRDISLVHSMIPLGSCTMKLNAAAEMLPLSWSEFTDVHPYVPKEQAAGYYQLIGELCADLAKITGFEAVSLQAGSGASGEYAGLMMIRRYHHSQNQAQRNIALIPASAHGTNPASASMAGMRSVVVACGADGGISLPDLQAKAAQFADTLACIMITYPSTHGVFEENITDIIDIVHRSGGLVYMDGANMNAQTGYTHPARMNADICHLNLHKTFAMPHGGGGPGAGAVCASKRLAQFLPDVSTCPSERDGGNFSVGFAPFGNALLLPITYGYIKMTGSEGLKKATAAAILNANYIACKLQPHFDVLYAGRNGRVAHECIVDCRRFAASCGIGAGDIARRLMDYGFHAPTVSFPVHDTLMIEPTESESKEELDLFIDALVTIKYECGQVEQGIWSRECNPVTLAPHTALEVSADEWRHPYSRRTAAFPLPYLGRNKFFPYVSKIDHAHGDRNLLTQNNH